MKMMKIRASHTATATASILALTGIFAASPMLAGDAGPIPPDRERPWQNDDGSVVIGDRTFKTWQDYHTSDLFRDGRFEKCGTTLALGDPGGDAQGFVGGGPSDCSMNYTNPSGIYDPSVVTYRIPVVVHVIRNASGSQGNLSVAQVESGIRILNEDFNALAGSNGENGNDARVEFYLAEEDPQGNPTNGITFSNNTTWFNDSGSYWNSLAWDPANYLNVYTNTAGGYLGYVPFYPQEGGVGSNADRVVVFWMVWGDDAPCGDCQYNLGRTLTHEVGHYLGLYHVFDNGCGSSNCSTTGDRICDTNPQAEETWGCSSANSCGSSDNIDNYMDYSDDLCMEEFTPNQTRRMRCAIEHYRPDLPIKEDCPADFNGDGEVSGGDLGMLLAMWGTADGDLNGDGTTSGADLGLLLSSWGPCTP